MKETLFVSFSGGRTSGYMCHWLIENKSDQYDLNFVFANTGLEHEKTLEFVDKCDKHFGLDLTWVEALVDPEHGKGVKHQVKTYSSAAKTGQPFYDVVKKYGIPNQDYPHCNRELKLSPIFDYKRSLGFKANHLTAIGIRADEVDRMAGDAKSKGLVYPLIEWTQKTKSEVIDWWSTQPFDLEIPEHLGNCVTCWKKSDRKLWTIAKHEPERFKYFADMEKKYPRAGHTGDSYQDRVFFRGRKSTEDILRESKLSFVEFKDYKPPVQGQMFDPIDIEADCGSGCEIS